jgi:ubiquinone/menaquinone biosynthesis C-methylase UbiE
MSIKSNIDEKVVSGFGDEWNRFDQSELSDHELTSIFDGYFSLFPWDKLPADSVGFDLGCGSGRWAKVVADKVGHLHCIDASELALKVAQSNLSQKNNCTFHLASVDKISLSDGMADFGYSLGVLHHVPDTQKGIEACVSKLKPGAPLLLYLYYAFDNRPFWYRWVWQVTEFLRASISRAPNFLRYLLSQVIALLIYLPLAKTSKLLEGFGFPTDNIPLADYRNRSFYTMRTDALDRFGTQLEQRFTKLQIQEMMSESGLIDIQFREESPYWCAIGYRK